MVDEERMEELMNRLRGIKTKKVIQEEYNKRFKRFFLEQNQLPKQDKNLSQICEEVYERFKEASEIRIENKSLINNDLSTK